MRRSSKSAAVPSRCMPRQPRREIVRRHRQREEDVLRSFAASPESHDWSSKVRMTARNVSASKVDLAAPSVSAQALERRLG